jgi:hypothetical protein
MTEIWKDISGYEGLYQVSNLGRIKSLNRINLAERKLKGRIRKVFDIGDGYIQVVLRKNNKPKHLMVHRLVGIAFIKNPQNKPQINHIDSNKSNNIALNLEWCTASENQIHAIINGKVQLGEDRQNATISNEQARYIRTLNKNGLNCVEIGKKLNKTRFFIWDVLNRTYKYA